MSKNQKLELTWVGKENRPRLEPRILIEDPTKSYHAAARVSEHDIFDNVLIHGDNLLALKALEADYAGQIKCIFIDPPYNTGSAFEHYDDGLEHSIWLGLMRDRLEIFKRLLGEDGSLWVTLDDNEAHYFKVVCDEVFGRTNFIADIAWQKSFAKKNKAVISGSHDHLLVYARTASAWRRNLLPRDDAAASAFKNVDDDPRGRWQSVAYSVPSEDGERRKAYRYEIELPSGRRVGPPAGRHWNGLPERTAELIADNRLWFGKDGNNPPRIKVFLNEAQDGIVPDTWWTHDQAGSTQDSKREMLQLYPDVEPFATPKPEKLLRRVLEIASSSGDLILDSFAGSGTTGAVAQKMGRRWIMVEIGDHATTHIVPRLRQVIDGTDQGGISKAMDWKGGGGFRYYELASSLLEIDKWGREVISKEYDANMLAQALCKLEGFTYAPSPDVYWQQGHSSESDFLYVTTQTLGPEELGALSDDVGEGRSLLILCAAFRGNAELWSNLTVRKIPNHIRSRCEWGHDDYSLNVANLPQAEVKATPVAPQPGLFDDGDAA
ncbi:MAG TPA: site-specific DNA-methyltransferase [Allosphingosinicella sp.]|jgi:adenine-specific DNA-methyltransferase|nr:site-specific DNA-methyltransferase [Allosphingosinicella sp.]